MKSNSPTIDQPFNGISNRMLFTIPMLGTPFLLLDFSLYGRSGDDQWYDYTSLTGLLSFIYVIGWVLSIEGLSQLKATNLNRFYRSPLLVQFGFLTLTNAVSKSRLVLT